MRRSLFILALFVAAATAPRALAQGQGSGPGPVLLEPYDFSPNGAWRRQAAAVA